MEKTIKSKEYKAFIEKLIKARLATGLRQIDVAKKMKRPQSYISRVESGEYRIDVMEIKRLAKFYKREISYFIK